jgi:hypothetical protein
MAPPRTGDHYSQKVDLLQLEDRVIPVTPCELDYQLPDKELWIPGKEELSSDEGFGGFRNTWVIKNVGTREAIKVIGDEAKVVEIIDALADSEDDFNALAAQFEFYDPEALAESGVSIPADSPLHDYLAEDWSPTDGLDLGVAGLVYALASVGCYPAASCRGRPHTWTRNPLVRFAGRLWRAQLLIPLAREAQCGLVESSGTVVIWAESVIQMMAMARLVMEHRKEFARNPSTPIRRSPPKGFEQLQLGVL